MFRNNQVAISKQACHTSYCAGKTTILEMLLRWLRGYLQKHSEDYLVEFFSCAMYPDEHPEALDVEQAETVRDFVAALRLLAGTEYHLMALLR